MGIPNEWRRAVSDKQKEERRQAILEAAWHLFQSTSYETLTIIDVARSLGLAKGTVFLYFKTKEALFLALLEQQLTDLFSEVDARLAEMRGGGMIAPVADLICQALVTRPGLTRLLAILHTLLERNIDLKAAIDFKYFLLAHFERTGALLEGCLPFLEVGQGAHFLLQCHALVIGFWHLADPAPIVRQALEQPALHMFNVQFAPEFSAALQALLTGLANGAEAARK